MEQTIEREVVMTSKESLLLAQVPQASRTYKPVSHKQLIDLSLESIDKAGFTIKHELYSSARKGNVANARYVLNYGDNEMNIMVGWQNSYDKSLSFKFACGSNIIICKNGMVKGDMGAFKKKHMGDIQEFAPNRMIEDILSAGDIFQQLVRDRERMKEIEVTKKTCAELIGRMYLEEDIVTSTQLNIIKREMEKESFDYGVQGTLWNTYSAITYALKSGHPSNWLKQHVETHNFFVNEYSL